MNCIRVEYLRRLLKLCLVVSAVGCVSEPSVSIMPANQNAVASSADELVSVVAKNVSPDFDGVSGSKDADAPTEFIKTASGLEYRILRKSDGRRAFASSTVTVHYAGWLDDGTQFDSSYKNRQPLTIPLSDVVGGWTEGLQLVGETGMIELRIPSKLGYKEEGSPPVIPPNATLHFRIELLRVH